MRIIFIYLGAENLGIEALSAYLKAHGHQTGLVFHPSLFNDRRFLRFSMLRRWERPPAFWARKILDGRPDLVAFSAITDTYRWSVDVASEVRKHSGVPILFGGIHATSVPDLVLQEPSVDYVIRGEGEQALLELADSLGERGPAEGIGNLSYRRNGEIVHEPLRSPVEDLDSLPFGDRTLFEPYVDFRANFSLMTMRGCPYRCSFCCHHVLAKLYGSRGKMLRRRSPEHALEELRRAKDRYDFAHVNFEDSVFTLNERWLHAFLEGYRKYVARPFKCLSHPDGFTREMAEMLKKAGCGAVQFGVQTLNERTLRNVLHRPGTKSAVIEAFDHCAKAGLHYDVDHILGLPGEGPGDFLEAADLYNEAPALRKVKAFSLTLYPGTDIAAFMLEDGRIGREQMSALERGLGRSVFEGGSLSDASRFRPFHTLFRLIGILPRRWLRFLIRRRDVRVLRLLPQTALLPLEVVRAWRTEDRMIRSYIRDYLRNLKRAIAGRSR